MHAVYYEHSSLPPLSATVSSPDDEYTSAVTVSVCELTSIRSSRVARRDHGQEAETMTQSTDNLTGVISCTCVFLPERASQSASENHAGANSASFSLSARRCRESTLLANRPTGPDPLSESVRRSDQLLPETSEAG